jgi:hypothetical protein
MGNPYQSPAMPNGRCRTISPSCSIFPARFSIKSDLAVRKQGVSRTHFLRQAIERNLRHYMRHYKSVERAVFARIYRQGMS